ncbi:MAG: GntR family transcriptional regulator [Pseudonocardia sp. SCN 72-86]|nr:MAG: GntR family transcriptional regulator [Pseudonocardia sp. SCN 72-86]
MSLENRRGIHPVAERKASAVDLVLHEIRRSILNGALPPGRPFTVSALTDQLGVSHIPVREALRHLEAQGLVVLSPSRSAIVTPLDSEDLRAIFRLRITVEPELAALSAPHRTDADIDELARLVRATFERIPAKEFWGPRRDFYLALIRPAASEWDLRLLRPLWQASERYTRLVFDPGGETENFTDWRSHVSFELIQAARSRDPERMRAEVRQQLEANQQTLLEGLSCSEGGWSTEDETA